MKIKILILIDSYGKGGAEKSTSSFILKLKETYKEFDFNCVYLYHFTPGYYDELENLGIPVNQLKSKNFIGRLKEFRKIIKNYKPDIVHSVLYDSIIISRLSSPGLSPIFVESLVNKPYLKEREYQSKAVARKRLLIKQIDKYTSYLVDYFHSVGEAVAQHYKEVYSRDFPYVVVHRGRPVPALKPLNSKTNVENNKLKLITLARQEYQKGLIYLLRAVLELGDKVELKILGREGAATASLRSFVEENSLEKSVIFTGYVDNVSEHIAESDLYVSASLFEGLPGSVIEAMTMAKPLLLSDIEEHREVAVENKNAIFFESRNVNEIVDGINTFLKERFLISSYGNYSLSHYQENFTEKAMVQGMAEFYQKMHGLRKK